MNCENCNEKHDGSYGSGRFCTSKCARSFNAKTNRVETNKKVSFTLRSKKLTPWNKGVNSEIIICKNCKKEFYAYKNRMFCSRSCSSSYNNNHGDFCRKAGLKSAKIQSENRRSKNEIYFANLCSDYFKIVKNNENIFNGWDADIIIEDIKYAILWNGVWHYKKITEKHSVKQVQNRDKIKISEIEKCGYIPYIIKDMGKYNKHFVKEKFKEFLTSLNLTQ